MHTIDPFLSELKQAQQTGQQVLAAAARRRPADDGSGHRRGHEEHPRVEQKPALRAGLLGCAAAVERRPE